MSARHEVGSGWRRRPGPGDWSRLRATGDRSCFRLARARFSVVSMGLPLLGVLLSGLLSSLVALRAVSRAPLLAALRGIGSRRFAPCCSCPQGCAAVSNSDMISGGVNG